MSFALQRTNRNFSTSTVHGVLRLGTRHDGLLIAVVNSYANLEALQANMCNWQEEVPIPPEAAGNPQAWLISAAGPYAGGELIPEVGEMDRAKTVKLAEMKATRDKLEMSGFYYNGWWFDSDTKSFDRMVGAQAEAAKARAEGNESYAKAWRIANNEVVVLTAEDVMNLLPALAARATELHVIYNNRKAVIQAAESVEAVYAIAWPVIAPPPVPEPAE